MADDEYEMEWGSDDGANEMGAEGADEGEILIQNNFYEAEGIMKQQPAQALEMFETVIALEENRDTRDFSFNSVKYVVMLALQLQQWDKMISFQRQLLKMSSKVSKNDLTEAINAIQDQIQTHLSGQPD